MRFKTNSRLLAQLPAFCWTTDDELRLTSSFGGILELAGAPQKNLAGRHIGAVFAGEQHERVASAHARALLGEETAFDFVWFGRSLHAKLSPLFESGGSIGGTIGVAIDAPGGAKLEETLKKTQAALATAEYIAHLGSWSHDYCSGEVWWSQELYRILEISQDERPLARSLWSFDHPDDAAMIELTIAHAVSKRMPYSLEHRIVRPSGDTIVVLEQASFAFDHAGDRVHEVGTLLDITEQVKANGTLARGQDSFADAQRIASMGTWDANLETGEAWWSPGLYEIVGIDPNTPLRLSELRKYDHPDDRDRVRAASEEARRCKETYSVVYRIVRPNGVIRRVLERGADFFDWKGDRVRNVGVVIDITHEQPDELGP